MTIIRRLDALAPPDDDRPQLIRVDDTPHKSIEDRGLLSAQEAASNGQCKTYLLQALATGACLVAAIFIFNVLIDPFGILRLVTIAGINNDRSPALISGHRNTREIEIARNQPQAIIFGSSREMYGIDPADVARITGLKTQNAAIAALSAFARLSSKLK